jgi:hypothetical protein
MLSAAFRHEEQTCRRLHATRTSLGHCKRNPNIKTRDRMSDMHVCHFEGDPVALGRTLWQLQLQLTSGISMRIQEQIPRQQTVLGDGGIVLDMVDEKRGSEFEFTSDASRMNLIPKLNRSIISCILLEGFRITSSRVQITQKYII